ncbi:MAG: hypothetical protein AAF698_04280 [Pseudomonadota bacterium]
MKVEDVSHERLVIRDDPWWIITMLGGFGLVMAWVTVEMARDLAEFGGWILVPAGAAVLMGWLIWAKTPFQRIEFDRAQGTMTHRTRRVSGGLSVDVLPLSGIHKIRHESYIDSEGRTYRLVLETERGLWPLRGWMTGARHDALEETLREWLTAP